MADKTDTSIPPGRNYPVPEEKREDAGLGSVRIHNNVISVIAHEAADRVPGVVELSGTLVDGLADMIGKKGRDRGIRVAVASENTISIELTVVLEFGVNIPETCGQLQIEVRRAIEDMTGKNVEAVNVSVQGIRRGTADPSVEE
jgi:uncharacterized alkaline shock family protein YloU